MGWCRAVYGSSLFRWAHIQAHRGRWQRHGPLRWLELGCSSIPASSVFGAEVHWALRPLSVNVDTTGLQDPRHSYREDLHLSQSECLIFKFFKGKQKSAAKCRRYGAPLAQVHHLSFDWDSLPSETKVVCLTNFPRLQDLCSFTPCYRHH